MAGKSKKIKRHHDRVFHFFKKKQQTVKIQKPFDVYLFFTTLLLVLTGIMMIFSSSAILAQEKYGDTYFFLKRELLYFLVGLIGLFFTKNISYKIYAKWIYPILGATLFFMLLCFIPPFSYSAGGASRWIQFGSITMQPSEFTKVVVIIFAAYLIAKKKDKIKEFTRGFLPVIAITGVYIVLILAQKDLGSAFVLGAVIFIMLFVSGTKTSYLIGSVLASAPVLYFLIFSVSFRKRRILAFLDPWKYKLDYGFQIIQSFVAFKSGGLNGVGLGESKQKLFYLPEAHTDFIFSVLGEEYNHKAYLFLQRSE